MKRTIFLLTLLQIGIFGIAQQAQNPFPKTISVSGSAEMEIVPDEIYVHITLSEVQKKGEAKRDLESIKQQFLQSARYVGIPDSSISIAAYTGGYNYYWWRKKKSRDHNLTATITYQVKFSNNIMMDALVDRLDEDATQSFMIIGTSHSKIAEFRKQLKIQAVRAAKEKSIYLAEALGEKPGEAITVTEPAEFNPGTPIPYGVANTVVSYGSMEKMDIGSKAQEVDFRKLKLRYNVDVVFALK